VIRKTLLLLGLLGIAFSQPTDARQTGIIETEEVIVLFEKPLKSPAKELAEIYPGIKMELEESLGWKLNFRPRIFLIKDRKKFESMAGSSFFVAYAVPQKQLVVIDYSRMNRGPFTLGITLKHELCHLLLHHYIRRAELPKWLDEGISQWISDGISELVMVPKKSVLKEAALAGRFMTMDQLTESFPEDRHSLLLAYEASKSFVEYIHRRFGREGILNILSHMRDGHEAGVAVVKALSIPLDELERRWQVHLRKKTTWVAYLARHLYGILFFLAALITIWGFIRGFIKKRRYEDDEDEISLT
jgi:hypothetical protein